MTAVSGGRFASRSGATGWRAEAGREDATRSGARLIHRRARWVRPLSKNGGANFVGNRTRGVNLIDED